MRNVIENIQYTIVKASSFQIRLKLIRPSDGFGQNMDFSKLSNDQLTDFLKLYGLHNDNFNHDMLAGSAWALFQLVSGNANASYTYPVLDLYISSNVALSGKNKPYKISSVIDNLDKFAESFSLDKTDPNLRERVLRILEFSGHTETPIEEEIRELEKTKNSLRSEINQINSKIEQLHTKTSRNKLIDILDQNKDAIFFALSKEEAEQLITEELDYLDVPYEFEVTYSTHDREEASEIGRYNDFPESVKVGLREFYLFGSSDEFWNKYGDYDYDGEEILDGDDFQLPISENGLNLLKEVDESNKYYILGSRVTRDEIEFGKAAANNGVYYFFDDIDFGDRDSSVTVRGSHYVKLYVIGPKEFISRIRA